MPSPFRVSISWFRITKSGWKCSCFTPDGFVEALAAEIAACCQQEGLQVVKDDADVLIDGLVLKAEEGNQALRYILPGLGAASVQLKGKITTPGGELLEFHQTQNGYLGLFGGSSRVMLRQALRRAALAIARDAHDVVNPGAARRGGGALTYCLAAAGIAMLVALLLAIGGVSWAHTLPQTNNSIKKGEILPWGLVVAATGFAATFLCAIAAAPARVLQDRSLLWLQSISGVRSVTALRAILFILAAVPAAICVFCFLVARGR
jgi:hypothetical protein